MLRKTEWLKDYPRELAEAMLAEGSLVRLNVGEWAQAEGDNRSGLFVVIEGVLHSYCAAPGDREVMIGLAEAGSVVGHATRFSGGPRLVTTVCVEPSVLLEISEAALERVAERRPEIWRAIAGFAYANMRSMVRMAAEVISLRPRERIAARLLAAVDGHRKPMEEPAPTIRLSQELLGEMTGLTRKTVNVHLSAFERDGLIEVGYGRITLCDLERLRAVANG
ncbi:Crp/Fnr family transcriptional regulator [Sphingobium estronivorans]|uniref:Crp/Fnr family transcriptional regulator n=1 Tax=Sphingobium estronivorans TaxID=1577690 RepID=UPI001F07AD38|nr:Crp/Fnr family transcriptional regulator [Sphingobium estronivorans]